MNDILIPNNKLDSTITMGKVEFTVVGPSKRQSFRVTRAEDGGCHFVAAIHPRDRDNQRWWFLGIIRNGRFRPTRNYADRQYEPEFEAFSWLWRKAVAKKIPDEIQVYRGKKCLRCGARLTTPKSIKAGLGPTCAKEVEEWKSKWD